MTKIIHTAEIIRRNYGHSGNWLSKMTRIDNQKVAIILYNDYVERVRLQKTEAVKEVRCE